MLFYSSILMKIPVLPLWLAMWLGLLLALTSLYSHSAAGQQTSNQTLTSPGLFPPITFTTNFASRTAVSATSTCSQFRPSSCGSVASCTSCNDTCPFGQDVPTSFSLLEEGLLSDGVQMVSHSAACIHCSSSTWPLCTAKAALPDLSSQVLALYGRG